MLTHPDPINKIRKKCIFETPQDSVEKFGNSDGKVAASIATEINRSMSVLFPAVLFIPTKSCWL